MSRRLINITIIALVVVTSTVRGGELVYETTIDAPIADVWNAITDADELETWMVQSADIDLRIGGLLRTSYIPDADLDGPQSIHHEILSFEPGRMLSFRTVKAPEGFSYTDLITKTWVVVTLESIGTNRTRVRETMAGYGEGEIWDEMREKFDAGNKWTLEQLRNKFQPKNESNDAEPAADRVMKLLTKLVGGEWLHGGEAPGGGVFRVRNIVTHGPDGRCLVAKGWAGDEVKMIEHSSMQVFRDPATQDVRFLSINEVGDIAEGPITPVNETTVEWDWRSRGADSNVYSVLMKFTGDEEYVFTLRLRLEDGSLQQLVEADFHRVDEQSP